MNEKKFLDDFLIKKTGQKGFKNLSKKNLINDGILDSLDVVTLSFLIKKKFNIDIKMNEKNIKIFNSYELLLNKIKSKYKNER